MRTYAVAAALLGVAALLLAVTVELAAAAPAPRDTSTVITSEPGAVWMMKLKGAKVRQMSYRGFAAFKATHRVTFLDNTTDPANPVTYSGVDLKALVGLIDDKHPRTFNVKLATTAPGYIVRVIGADGYSHDFTSAEVATENIVVANKVAAAGAVELALPFGTAKYKTSSDSAGFSPSWPLKLVGSFLTSGSMKVGGINHIILLPAAAATR